MTAARLLIADSEKSADMLYATGLFVPDPFVWCEVNGQRMVIVSPLEYGRAVKQVRPGTRVYGQDEANRLFGIEGRKLSAQAVGISRHFQVQEWEVPRDFPLGLAEELRAQGIDCRCSEQAFFPERECKLPDEIEKIREGVRLAEHGMERAFAILREATIEAGELIWQGETLTAERLRGEIDASITRLGGLPAHTIVAPGPEGADPHNAGSGPILTDSPVIIDIFPRVGATGYFGDLTRTVMKGKAPELVRRAFKAVMEARDHAKTLIRPGVNGQEVHQAVTERLVDHGFETDGQAKTPYGFFHGTGHGLGLEIHEAPRISTVDSILTSGHVVTVEPGLYYAQWGGVRLEDVVVVTESGCETLTSIATFLEVE